MLEAPLLVLRLLRVNVGLHLLQVEAHSGHRIAAGPEMFAREVSFLPRELSRDRNGTLPLEKPHDGRHGILRWDLDAHVHVVRHQVPMHDPTLLLPSQLVEDSAELLPDAPK